MQICDETRLKSILSNNKLKNVFILFGEDHYLVRYYAKLITQKAVGSDDTMNLNRFESGARVQEILDAAEMLPFLGDSRCVQICDLFIDKLNADEYKKLCEFVSDPAPQTVMIFWFESVGLDVKKLTEKYKKLFAAADKAGGTVANLTHRRLPEIIKILCDGANKRSCRMEPTTAKYLIEMCSNDLMILLSELEKLCAYSKNGLITCDMIDVLCPRTIEASVYDLFKKTNSGDMSGAYKILDDLFVAAAEPIVILSVLSSSYIDMQRVRAAEKAGIKAANVAEPLGYPKNRAFTLDIAQRSAKEYTDRQLLLSIDELKVTDKRLKSVRCDYKIVLEELITRLVYIKSRGEKPC